MLFDPHKIVGAPDAENRLVWSAIQSGTTSILGLNRNVGSTIITGNDPTSQLRTKQARYSYDGQLVAVRRSASTDPEDFSDNRVDFYDNTGAIVRTLNLDNDPTLGKNSWFLDENNNIYSLGPNPTTQLAKTDFITGNISYIPLTVPAGVTPVLDIRHIAYEPPGTYPANIYCAEASRDPNNPNDPNIYTFSTTGTYISSTRKGLYTSSQDLVVSGGTSSRVIFLNYTGQGGGNDEIYILGTAGPPILITSALSARIAINQSNNIFVLDGVRLYKYNIFGTLLANIIVSMSSSDSTLSVDQFNNIFITDFQNGHVYVYRQNNLTLKWDRAISDVTTTVGDYMPIGYKTNWD